MDPDGESTLWPSKPGPDDDFLHVQMRDGHPP